jgi:ankyrin repeat protein
VTKNGDAERVRVLLKAGASPNPAPNAAAFTSLKNFTKLKLPNHYNAPMDFQIPLHNAVDNDNLQMVDLLIKAGVEVGVKDWQGQTALFYAQSTEIAKRLMQVGLSLEEPAANGWVPLVMSIEEGYYDRVKTFLAVGADIHHRHDHGYTIFMSAVGSTERKMEIIHLLLNAGADPLAVSDYGWNAFHAALTNGDMKQNSEEFVQTLFELILKLGVDINHKNKSGVTPLIMAQKPGLEIEKKILLQLGAKT